MIKNINLLKLLTTRAPQGHGWSPSETNKLNINNNNKLLLKTLLLELNKNRLSKNIINNKNINKYINELNNKGNKLQHVNNINN